MKKLSIIVVFAMIFSLFIPHTYAADDINGHYFEDDMRALIQKDILGGYNDGSYRPDSYVTRAEFTVFLLRTLDISSRAAGSSSFNDVKEDAWYHSAIAAATRNKLIGGYSDGSFKPKRNISRQEMAAMIKRALDFKGIKADEKPLAFTDKSEINPMFHPAIRELLYLNIIGGKKNSTGIYFAPFDHTTRGETAALLNRMLRVTANQKESVDYTHYNYDFKEMVDIQVTRTPKVDGAGKFIASRELVAYYANPNNFSRDSSKYLQFLILSQNAGLNANEINNKVLMGKGSLAGEAKAFIEAGRRYNVNEVYLIAHALHETGNGTSTLASGVPVDKSGNIVSQKNAAYTVYNMYGYGAYDSDPLKGGAKYAFDQGWFSPAAAIIGGAEDISNSYINDGQDTLYKMRWNPISPGYPQYATHVSWSVLQTNRIQEIYSLLDSYVLKYDVPAFNNQPAASPKPTGEAQYHVNRALQGEKGKTTHNLNFRTGPATSFNIIKTLPQGTGVTIIGENGGWYKISADDAAGWVSGDYIHLDKENKSAKFAVLDKDTDSSVSNKKQAGFDTIPDGLIGTTTADNVHLRTEPSISNPESIIRKLAAGTTFNILEEKNGWYFLKVNDEEGWIYSDYVALKNLIQVVDMEANLNVRKEPGMDSQILGKLSGKSFAAGVLDSEGNIIQKGDWYQIYFAGENAWIHRDFIKL